MFSISSIGASACVMGRAHANLGIQHMWGTEWDSMRWPNGQREEVMTFVVSITVVTSARWMRISSAWSDFCRSRRTYGANGIFHFVSWPPLEHEDTFGGGQPIRLWVITTANGGVPPRKVWVLHESYFFSLKGPSWHILARHIGQVWYFPLSLRFAPFLSIQQHPLIFISSLLIFGRSYH